MLDGADLILDTSDRFAGRFVVVALGPLSNAALALRRDPRRLARAARIVVMGGAVAVPGNVTAAAEFNLHVDPEAAALVFASGLQIELVPLDVTRRVVMTRADLGAALARHGGRTARFIEDFTAHGFDFETQRGDGGMALHAPLAVGVAVGLGAGGTLEQAIPPANAAAALACTKRGAQDSRPERAEVEAFLR